MFAEVISDRGRGPVLVYLPGIDGSGQLLLGTAPRLEERFRLIRLRYRLAPGVVDTTPSLAMPPAERAQRRAGSSPVGKTDGLPGANRDHRTYAHLAASAIEAVSLRGAERPLLLAESFGGAVALRAALDFPDTVAAIALVNSFAHYRRRVRLSFSRVGTFVTPNWMIATGRRILAPWFLFGGPAERQAIEEFLGRPPGAGAAARIAAPARTVNRALALDEGYPARLRMIQGLDLRGELGRVRQPVALFASGRDRIVDAVRQAREMAAALPDAELEILEGRGHVVLPVGEIDWPARLERLAGRARVSQ